MKRLFALIILGAFLWVLGIITFLVIPLTLASLRPKHIQQTHLNIETVQPPVSTNITQRPSAMQHAFKLILLLSPIALLLLLGVAVSVAMASRSGRSKSTESFSNEDQKFMQNMESDLDHFDQRLANLETILVQQDRRTEHL